MDKYFSRKEITKSFNYIVNNEYSYFFPEIFEIELLKNNKEKICDYLVELDLYRYNPNPSCSYYLQKQNMVFMPIMLIDPLDLIIFSALVSRLIHTIELKRGKFATTKVFSYNYTGNKNNIHFENRWVEYSQIVKSKGFDKVVAKLDISNFFPSINRNILIQKLLQICPNNKEDIGLIEKFLSKWQLKDNKLQGIPIGFEIINYLAEMFLVDIDVFLIKNEIDFVRYIDDIMIFSNTVEEARVSISKLAYEMIEKYDLLINGSKTFVGTYYGYIDHISKPNIFEHEFKDEITDTIFQGNLSLDQSLVYRELNSKERKLLEKIKFKESLIEALDRGMIDINSVNFILIAMASIREPSIIDEVLKNLNNLGRVSKTLSKFLESILLINNKKLTTLIEDEILDFILSKKYFLTEYQKIWLLSVFPHKFSNKNIDKIVKIIQNDENSLCRRQGILALNNSDYLNNRNVMEQIMNNNNITTWELRALFEVCKLNKFEKRKLIKNFRNQKLIADYVINDFVLQIIIE